MTVFRLNLFLILGKTMLLSVKNEFKVPGLSEFAQNKSYNSHGHYLENILRIKKQSFGFVSKYYAPSAVPLLLHLCL